MALTGLEILAIDDRKMESVVVKEWNDEVVYIRTMGALERASFDAKLIELKDLSMAEKMVLIKITLILLCACNEAGDRLFTDDQFDELSAKSSESIDRIYRLVDEMNIMTQVEVEKEKEK